jgi:hypothetical protein
MGRLRAIQVIDRAANCTFSLFLATDEEFSVIFPGEGQDIEFAEDLEERLRGTPADISGLWQRPVRKPEANGIHGTLFFEFAERRGHFPATKRERDWSASALNEAQRRLFSGS